VSRKKLPRKLEKALILASQALSEVGARWLLAGSTASFLNGLKVEPKDLDIIVETPKVYDADRVFAEHFKAERRVSYSSTGLYASHYGVFKINWVNVDLMAELEICCPEGCMKLDFDTIYPQASAVRVGGIGVRLLPLEWQLVANTMIPGKEKRVKAILELLSSEGYSRVALKSALDAAPNRVRKQVEELLRRAGIVV